MLSAHTRPCALQAQAVSWRSECLFGLLTISSHACGVFETCKLTVQGWPQTHAIMVGLRCRRCSDLWFIECLSMVRNCGCVCKELLNINQGCVSGYQRCSACNECPYHCAMWVRECVHDEHVRAPSNPAAEYALNALSVLEFYFAMMQAKSHCFASEVRLHVALQCKIAQLRCVRERLPCLKCTQLPECVFGYLDRFLHSEVYAKISSASVQLRSELHQDHINSSTRSHCACMALWKFSC